MTDGCRLMVLGAGRLWDFDSGTLLETAEHVDLVDVDPLCRRAWRRLARDARAGQLQGHLCEVTGVLLLWRQRLRERCQRCSLFAVLEELRMESVTALDGADGSFQRLLDATRPHAILSLNMLSQLPVLWQNIVESELRRRFGRSAVGEAEEAWLAAFLPSAQSLLKLHVRQLLDSGAHELLVITDREYVRIPSQLLPSTSAATAGLAPYVRWDSNRQTWRWENAVTGREDWLGRCERLDALYGFAPERWLELTQERWTPFRALDEWAWLISPVPEKGQPYALAHRVAALRATREATATL